jgi:prepilin-type N-terminal cleavage/methylation domain-containing protein
MTLMEVLMVLAMLGVLTSLAVIASRPVADRYRLRDGSR